MSGDSGAQASGAGRRAGAHGAVSDLARARRDRGAGAHRGRPQRPVEPRPAGRALRGGVRALTGATHCLATANGTSALLTTLGALDVGPGDEVIVPPYTFVATINAVLLRHALPVFVDTDIETFQIDARKVAAAITDRTKVVMPVHLGGAAADLDTILAAAARARRAGARGCVSGAPGRVEGPQGRHVRPRRLLQLPGEQEPELRRGRRDSHQRRRVAGDVLPFHNNSRGRATAGSTDFSYRGVGANLRLTEFQAAMLLAQMTRLERAGAHARRQRRVSDDAAVGGSRASRRRARYAGLHAQRVSPLHVPLRQRGLRRPDARAVPQGAARRRRARLGRLLAADQGALGRRDAGGPRLPADLRQGRTRPAGRAQPVPARTSACAARRCG